MAEAYGFHEGFVYIATGSFAASALASFCESTNTNLQRGWLNRVAADGVYRDHITGKRVDVSIGAMYSTDGTLMRIFESATAVHMKLLHFASGIGSGGLFLYSGRIDACNYNGSQNNPYQYTLTYHSNVWSAF